jgi:RNA polymerase sigma factor for flagellar operon FliA
LDVPAPDSAEVLALFEEALELVEILATEVARVISSPLEHGELVSFGHEGALSAARRFEPARGVPFRGYASYRIRGAILDGIRRSGPIPRKTHELIVAMERSSSASEGNAEQVFGTGRDDDDEMERELRPHLADVTTAAALGLVARRLRQELEMQAADASNRDPEDALVKAELLELVRRTVPELGPSASELIRRHYFEGETLEEIARELAVSGSWASRLHTKAILSLKKRMLRTT